MRPAILQVGLDHVQVPPAHVTASVAEQGFSAAVMRAGVETQAVGLLSWGHSVVGDTAATGSCVQAPARWGLRVISFTIDTRICRDNGIQMQVDAGSTQVELLAVATSRSPLASKYPLSTPGGFILQAVR